MSMKKAMNGLEGIRNMDYRDDGAQLLNQLLERYVETQDKNFWNAARAIAHSFGLNRYIGHLPHNVEQVIGQVAEEVYNAAHSYYGNIKDNLGFVPFNVRNRRLLDRDDMYERENVEVLALAQTQANSVTNKLKDAYNKGDWDGTEKSIKALFRKYAQIFLEGAYHPNDLR